MTTRYDHAKGHEARRLLCDIGAYPTGTLEGDPGEDAHEANSRAILHRLADELGRDDVIALAQFVRFLALTPPASHLWGYYQARQVEMLKALGVDDR